MKNIKNKETGVVTEWTDEGFIVERDRLLRQNQIDKEALEIAKEKEMASRKAAVDFSFDQEINSGTERIDLGNGYQAKSVKKLNYGWRQTQDGKIDRKAIEKALSKIESDGPTGELIADRLVKWSPTLSLTEYNQLPTVYKKTIDEVIVTTEGAPTLEIIEPKAKK